MNKTALLFGVGASLILAAGTASAAGSCGAEVAELQQKLGMEEGANATIGATDPGVQQPQAGGSDTLADSSSSSSTTTMPSGTVEETSRVGDLNTAAGGRAEAITALKKAQMAADANDEDTCMMELGNAKTALGVE